jgi:hypothetical protein
MRSRLQSKTFPEISVPSLQFVGEQDGPAERLLKDRLTTLFCQDKTVRTAYLAKVDNGGGEISVLLGLTSARMVMRFWGDGRNIP